MPNLLLPMHFWIYTALIIIISVLLCTFPRLFARERRKLHEMTKSRDVELHEEDAILLWQTTYQEVLESLRDQAKLYASVNFAGLAGGIALYSSSRFEGLNGGRLEASLICFSLGLVFSLLPITYIAEKAKDDLACAMLALSTPKPSKVTLNHPWPKGAGFLSGIVNIALISLGVCLLIFSIK